MQLHDIVEVKYWKLLKGSENIFLMFEECNIQHCPKHVGVAEILKIGDIQTMTTAPSVESTESVDTKILAKAAVAKNINVISIICSDNHIKQ